MSDERDVLSKYTDKIIEEIRTELSEKGTSYTREMAISHIVLNYWYMTEIGFYQTKAKKTIGGIDKWLNKMERK